MGASSVWRARMGRRRQDRGKNRKRTQNREAGRGLVRRSLTWGERKTRV